MITRLGKFIAPFMLMALFAVTAGAQNDTMVSVPISKLTVQQKAELSSQALSDKVAGVGKYAGVGKEIGEAVNSGLQAVTANASAFADTRVGKFTMFVIAWKVMGNDLSRVFFAIMFGVIGVPLWAWSYYKNVVPKRILKEEKKLPDGTKVKTYEMFEPAETKGYGENLSQKTGYQFMYFAALFILLIVVVAVF